MIVLCTQCRTTLRIPDKLEKDKKYKIGCPKCGHERLVNGALDEIDDAGGGKQSQLEKQSTNLCLLCASSGAHTFRLTDNRLGFFHKSCLTDLKLRFDDTTVEIDQLESEIFALERQLKNLSVVIDTVVTTLGGNSKIANIKREIRTKACSLNQLKASIQKLARIHQHTFDYFPDYPPDWTMRRKEILEKTIHCQQCDSGNRLQVHHRKPLSSGGSNKPENLILLCHRCHAAKHNFSAHDFLVSASDYSHDYWKTKTRSLSNLSKRQIIEKAIEAKRWIQFEYRGMDDDTYTVRKIRPREFKKFRTTCVIGICEKKGELRNFSLDKRMRKVQIV